MTAIATFNASKHDSQEGWSVQDNLVPGVLLSRRNAWSGMLQMSVIGGRGRDILLHGFGGGREFCSNMFRMLVTHVFLVILVISLSSW